MNLKENARKDKIAKKFITDLCVFIYFINNRDNGVWILKVYPRNSFFIFERRLVANTLIIILLQKIKFFSFNTRLIHHFNPVFFFIITIIIIKYIFRQRSNVRMKNKDLKKRFFFHLWSGDIFAFHSRSAIQCWGSKLFSQRVPDFSTNERLLSSAFKCTNERHDTAFLNPKKLSLPPEW